MRPFHSRAGSRGRSSPGDRGGNRTATRARRPGSSSGQYAQRPAPVSCWRVPPHVVRSEVVSPRRDAERPPRTTTDEQRRVRPGRHRLGILPTRVEPACQSGRAALARSGSAPAVLCRGCPCPPYQSAISRVASSARDRVNAPASQLNAPGSSRRWISADNVNAVVRCPTRQVGVVPVGDHHERQSVRRAGNLLHGAGRRLAGQSDLEQADHLTAFGHRRQHR
jgi:hypothetical protein